MLDPSESQRMERAANVWLASVRPNGAPHLIPIWFVWLDDRAFICTSTRSVKAQNILNNPRVCIALEDGSDPLVMEASARLLDEPPDAVVQGFREKYDWDIRDGGIYDAVIEIIPSRVLL